MHNIFLVGIAIKGLIFYLVAYLKNPNNNYGFISIIFIGKQSGHHHRCQ